MSSLYRSEAAATLQTGMGTDSPTPAIDIRKLTTEKRLQLISNLWESLRPHPEAVPATPAHKAELDRRLDALDRDEIDLVPRDEVKRLL